MTGGHNGTQSQRRAVDPTNPTHEHGEHHAAATSFQPNGTKTPRQGNGAIIA